MNDLINTRFLLNLGMSIYIPVISVSALYYAIGHFINKENAKNALRHHTCKAVRKAVQTSLSSDIDKDRTHQRPES